MVKGGEARRRAFVEVLLAEMELAAAEGEGRPFDTIYFGGGTPSILSADQLDRLISGTRDRLGALPDAWIFLEANPEDLVASDGGAGDRAARQRLEEWRRLGVRTVSLGVQSFGAEELAFLGRRHSPRQARRALELALEAGFHTVSLDLIYGLPGQSIEAWRRDLEAAISLRPQHLSCYQLTVEEGTPLAVRRAQGRLREMPDDEQAALFELTHSLLADAGYPAYEVSSFARSPDHHSRHNRKYWHHTPYLGLGPSAHSFDGRRRRFWNERRLHQYQESVRQGRRPLAGKEVLSLHQLALEMVMLGLRTREGVDLRRFREVSGKDLIGLNAARIETLIERGLLRRSAERLAPTPRGLAVAEAIAAELEVSEP